MAQNDSPKESTTSSRPPIRATRNGLEVDTKVYKPTGNLARNDYYWNPEFVNLIRQHPISSFLPNVSYDSSNHTATFSQYAGSTEYCGSSRPMTYVSKESLEALKKATEDLKSRGAQGGLLGSFKLPDPGKSPELYRVGKDGRILVLWGCQAGPTQDQLGYVEPTRAAEIISKAVENNSVRARTTSEIQRENNLKKLLWLVPLLLLLLGGFLAWLLIKPPFHQPNGTPPPPSAITAKPAERQVVEGTQILRISTSQVPDQWAPVLIRASATLPGRINIGQDYQVKVEPGQEISKSFDRSQVVNVHWTPGVPDKNDEFKNIDVVVLQRDKKPDPMVDPILPDPEGELDIVQLGDSKLANGTSERWLQAKVRDQGKPLPQLSEPVWYSKDQEVAKGWDVVLGFPPGKHAVKAVARTPDGKDFTGRLTISVGDLPGRARIQATPVAGQPGQYQLLAAAEAGSDGVKPVFTEASWEVKQIGKPESATFTGVEASRKFEPGDYQIKVVAKDAAGKEYPDDLPLQVEGSPGPVESRLVILKHYAGKAGAKQKYELRAALDAPKQGTPALSPGSVKWRITSDGPGAVQTGTGTPFSVDMSRSLYRIFADAKDDSGKDFHAEDELDLRGGISSGMEISYTLLHRAEDGSDYEFTAVPGRDAKGVPWSLEKVDWEFHQLGGDFDHRTTGIATKLKLRPGTYVAEAQATTTTGEVVQDRKVVTVLSGPQPPPRAGGLEILVSDPLPVGKLLRYDLTAVSVPGPRGEPAPVVGLADWAVMDLTSGAVVAKESGTNQWPVSLSRGAFLATASTKDAAGKPYTAMTVLVPGETPDEPPSARIDPKLLQPTDEGGDYQFTLLPIAGSDGIQPEFVEVRWNITSAKGAVVSGKTGAKLTQKLPNGLYKVSANATGTDGRPFSDEISLPVGKTTPRDLLLYTGPKSVEGQQTRVPLYARLHPGGSPELEPGSVQWKLLSRDGSTVNVASGADSQALIPPGKYLLSARGTDAKGTPYEAPERDLEIPNPAPPIAGIDIRTVAQQAEGADAIRYTLRAVEYGNPVAPKLEKVSWQVIGGSLTPEATVQTGQEVSYVLPRGTYVAKAAATGADGTTYTSQKGLDVNPGAPPATRGGVEIIVGGPVNDHGKWRFDLLMQAYAASGSQVPVVKPGDWTILDEHTGLQVGGQKGGNEMSVTLKPGQYRAYVQTTDHQGQQYGDSKTLRTPGSDTPSWPAAVQALLDKTRTNGANHVFSMTAQTRPGSDGYEPRLSEVNWQIQPTAGGPAVQKSGLSAEHEFAPGDYSVQMSAQDLHGISYRDTKAVHVDGTMTPGELIVNPGNGAPVDGGKMSYNITAEPNVEPGGAAPKLGNLLWKLRDGRGKQIEEKTAPSFSLQLAPGGYSVEASGKGPDGRLYTGSAVVSVLKPSPNLTGLFLEQKLVEAKEGKNRYRMTLTYFENGVEKPITAKVQWVVGGKALEGETKPVVEFEAAVDTEVTATDAEHGSRKQKITK